MGEVAAKLSLLRMGRILAESVAGWISLVLREELEGRMLSFNVSQDQLKQRVN